MHVFILLITKVSVADNWERRNQMNDAEERIKKALEIAKEVSEHHTLWTIDQMVRALTGCRCQKITFFKENLEYRIWVKNHNENCLIKWDKGISPMEE